MTVFNYKEFYNAFENGFIEKNKTDISELLFKPLFEPAELVDKNGTPYAIDNNNASKWCNGNSIPAKVRKAVVDEIYKDDINLYFNRNVLDSIEDDLKQDMLDSLIHLVNSSNLNDSRKKQLNDYYQREEYGDFLAYAFMSAIIGSSKTANKQTQPIPSEGNPEGALEDFRKIVQKYYTKPVSLPVPEEIDEQELKYVTALYAAYKKTSGKNINDTDDLGNYKKHFDRQRKNYYLAETIHRELRDTIHHNEVGFDTLKEEVEEGIVETSERVYASPVEKVDSVMEKAGAVPISHNTDEIMLGWIGVGEKKGVCHMLVNEDRLKWVDDDE